MPMDDISASQDRKPYQAPKLTNYGRIERLTTGGSGPEPEMNTIEMGMLVMDMAQTRQLP